MTDKVDIHIAGFNDFHCPARRTAQEATKAIRSGRGLINGEIERNGVAMFPDDEITAGGEYHFVNFQPATSSMALSVSNDKLDSIEKKLNFLIDINAPKEKSKKGKSGGSQVSSKDYDNGGYLFEHFEFDAFDEGFNQQEFDLISEELYKITSNIKRRVDEKSHTTYAIISSNTVDEVAIVQDEIWKLCDCLCHLYHQHSHEEISFTAELPYSDKDSDTNSSIDNSTSTSSGTTNPATNKKGRIDYTFHGHQHGLSVSLGLLECKNTSKQVYSDGKFEILTSDGKKSIAQSFIQLKSQVNKLFNSMNVNPKLFVCLLTTGKKWLVLRTQYYQGQSFYHSQEVELLTQEGNLVEPDSEKLRIVTNMLLYLLFSIGKVNDDINENKESFTKALHGVGDDENDDAGGADPKDEDDDFDESNEEDHNYSSSKNEKRKFQQSKRDGSQISKKKKRSGHSDSWKYAHFTVENLLKHQQLIK